MRERRKGNADAKLRLAIRASQIGIWDWDLVSGQMDYSVLARAICGFSPDEPITIEKVRAIVHPDDLRWTAPKAQRALDPEIRDNTPYEYRIVRPDTGAVRWVLAHGEAFFASDADGKPKAVRYLGTLQDIDARKRAEHALAASEGRLRLAMQAARLAVWELDIVTESLATSPELNRLFGLPADATPSIEELRSLYAPGERERVRQVAMDALAAGSTQFETEFQCQWTDGSRHWLLVRAEVLSEAGQYSRVIGVVLDIDERKRTQDRLGLLLREVHHRVKNSLSVVQALATQSFRGGRAEPDALLSFRERLKSLALANDTLLRENFAALPLRSLVEEIMSPYADADHRVSIAGGDDMLPARLATPLTLVLHELATNAAKYGALSAAGGRVEIGWEVDKGNLRLSWKEFGGPPVSVPAERGFGTRLIEHILEPELGKVLLRFDQAGLSCELTIPLPNQPC
jgi:PAS domain S-box-containing protein